jgi:hypothetical protein
MLTVLHANDHRAYEAAMWEGWPLPEYRPHTDYYGEPVMQQIITFEVNEDRVTDSFNTERKRRMRVRQARQRSFAIITSRDALNVWNRLAKKSA